MQRCKRLCLVFLCSCTNNSYTPFVIKCPVCHFQNYSLEGVNTKHFSTSTLRRQKWTKRTTGSLDSLFIIHLYLQSNTLHSKQYTNYISITFYYWKAVYILHTAPLSIPVQYFSLDKLFVLRDCDILKTFHFGWRTFTNSRGVTRFSPKQSHWMFMPPEDDFAKGRWFNTACWTVFDQLT